MRKKVNKAGIKSEAKVKCKRMSMEDCRRKIRNCLVAKSLMVPDYFKKNQSERRESGKKRLFEK